MHANGKNGWIKDECIVFKSIIENYRIDDYMNIKNYMNVINFKKWIIEKLSNIAFNFLLLF